MWTLSGWTKTFPNASSQDDNQKVSRHYSPTVVLNPDVSLPCKLSYWHLYYYYYHYYLLAGVLNPGVMSPGNGVVRPRGSTAVVFISPIATFLFSTESGTGVNLRRITSIIQLTIKLAERLQQGFLSMRNNQKKFFVSVASLYEVTSGLVNKETLQWQPSRIKPVWRTSLLSDWWLVGWEINVPFQHKNGVYQRQGLG